MKTYILGSIILIASLALIVTFLTKSSDEADVKPDSALNDERIVSQFRAFASDPSQENFEQLPLGEEVLLGLGDEIVEQRTKEELKDVQAWVIERDEFRAYAGPFSALELVDDSSVAVEVSVGPHDHCASPPVPAPSEVADLRRISIQPVLGENSSCLSWWTVDLFVTGEHKIRAITLDLWEP